MSDATVAELWRYPVKSMQGERVETLELDTAGAVGDRCFAVESTGAPTGKPLLTGRERAATLRCRAATRDRRVTVQTPARGAFDLHDEGLLTAVAEMAESPHRLRLIAASEPLTDCRPLSMISLETVALLSAEHGSQVDARRFRANFVLRFESTASSAPGFPEDAWIGSELTLGTAVLRITERDPRCRIVILDPETGAADPALMKHIDRLHGGRVGVYATVVRGGTVHVGDPVKMHT